jgi:hypothetical protein
MHADAFHNGMLPIKGMFIFKLIHEKQRIKINDLSLVKFGNCYFYFELHPLLDLNNYVDIMQNNDFSRANRE